MHKLFSFFILIVTLCLLSPNTPAAVADDDAAVAPMLAKLAPFFLPTGDPADDTPQTIEEFDQRASPILKDARQIITDNQIHEFLDLILGWRAHPPHNEIPLWDWFDVLTQSLLQLVSFYAGNAPPDLNPYLTLITHITTDAIFLQYLRPITFDWWVCTRTMLHITCRGLIEQMQQAFYWASGFIQHGMDPMHISNIYYIVATFIMGRAPNENLEQSVLAQALAQSVHWPLDAIHTNLERVLRAGQQNNAQTSPWK